MCYDNLLYVIGREKFDETKCKTQNAECKITDVIIDCEKQNLAVTEREGGCVSSRKGQVLLFEEGGTQSVAEGVKKSLSVKRGINFLIVSYSASTSLICFEKLLEEDHYLPDEAHKAVLVAIA